MSNESQREKVIASLPKVLAGADEVAAVFHDRLFARRPQLTSLFAVEHDERRRNFVKMLNVLAFSLTSKPNGQDIAPSQDIFMVLLSMNRREQGLYRVPDDAHVPVGEAIVQALSEAPSLKFEPGLCRAWAEVYADLSNVQRVANACKVHPFELENEAVRLEKGALIMSGEFDDIEPAHLLCALGDCRQLLRVSFQDKDERHSGELWLRSGQVLVVECQDEGGQPAFRLLLMRPHHRFRVERMPDHQMPRQGPEVGAITDLLATCEPRGASEELVDPSRLAANGEAPLLLDLAEEKVPFAESDALPVPFVESDALPMPFVESDALPMPLQRLAPLAVVPDAQSSTTEPEALGLTRIVLPWVAKLSEIPHLRGLVLLASSEAEEGKFWSAQGALMTSAELGRFGRACMRAHAQLSASSELQDSGGWRSTTEHRLGCLVVDVDAGGLGRLFLFDPATPLGKVRHTVEALISLSQIGQRSAK